jgi:hypothetical protein
MENNIDPFVETLLHDPINSYLFFGAGLSNEIIIGVPHHAPINTTRLPCREHPDADENAGFIGYYLSCLLNCPCIIACNYFLDPNKDKGTDYFKKILELMPKLLVEIHGHGSNSARFDIEISSGSQEKTFWSKELEERLRLAFSRELSFRNLSMSGDFEEIYFKATKSVSITTDKWVAFHLELPKSIRQSKSLYMPFCELLAETIRDLLGDFNNIIKAKTIKGIL